MKKFFAMIALMLPMAVMAQEVKDTTAAVPAQINAIQLAMELSKYGYANNDALSLIQAARISKQNGFTAEARDKEGADEPRPAVPEGNKNGQISLDPAHLLADAQAMANNDGVLLAMINDVNNNVRGRVGGAAYHEDNVLAHSNDYYNITFRGGQSAYICVDGDGDTDLDLYVYDSNGNLVAYDDDYTDTCICTWTPRRTQTYRIKIVNRGNVYNHYVLTTN
ncbi:MAG: hypothetical protein IJT98_01060 [Prevotella sp.]|nr:hypothetical protein [Prevotella sp.]